MRHFDVFNGDADGICALQQLRLAAPRAARLVTGCKRDIALLARVDAAAGDTVTVLDVSLARNRGPLQALLERGVAVQYFDHHYAGEPIAHPRLQLHIDPAPGACTSVLVDRHLAGAHRAWAVVGAFGDNLADTAFALAQSLGLEADAIAQLRQLGEAINYNAYGESEADLLLHPALLYEKLHPYASPFGFLAAEGIAADLATRQAQDLALAHRLAPAAELPGGSVYLLPDEAWARRVQGVFANLLSLAAPRRAHAVLRATPAGFNVSVRAPQRDLRGADVLCMAFPGGGGRAGAAGIDALPRARQQEFIEAFGRAFAAGG